jgi:hypothetical protein
MPTENKVFTKLFSDKKVDLSTISELELLTKGAESDLQVFDNVLNDWVIKYIDLQKEVNGILNLADIAANSNFDLATAMSKFQENAESLGINPFKFDEFANATLTTGSYDNNIEDLNDTLSVLKTMKQL